MPKIKKEKIFSVDGKIAVVIGAARGIGYAIASLFAKSGGKVIMADLDGLELNRKVQGLKSDGYVVHSLTADIRNSKDMERLGQETLKLYGQIDDLYITPGINIRKRFLDYTEEEFQKVIDINLKGSFLAMKELAKLMVNNENGGSIILISSIRSQVVEPGQSIYSATKAGIVQMVRGLASELGRYNIRVNAIAPGIVETDLTEPIKNDPEWYRAYKEKTALKRWADPYEIAGPAVFLATKAAAYIDGTVIFVDGGWTAIDGRFEPNLDVKP
ncbi:MAG: SDR family oxidoreductase [Nitrososphaerota archaeon]